MTSSRYKRRRPSKSKVTRRRSRRREEGEVVHRERENWNRHAGGSGCDPGTRSRNGCGSGGAAAGQQETNANPKYHSTSSASRPASTQYAQRSAAQGVEIHGRTEDPRRASVLAPQSQVRTPVDTISPVAPAARVVPAARAGPIPTMMAAGRAQPAWCPGSSGHSGHSEPSGNGWDMQRGEGRSGCGGAATNSWSVGVNGGMRSGNRAVDGNVVTRASSPGRAARAPSDTSRVHDMGAGNWMGMEMGMGAGDRPMRQLPARAGPPQPPQPQAPTRPQTPMQTQKQAQAQVQQPRAQPGAQPPRDTRETRHPPAQTQVQATAPPCTRNRVIDVRARGVPPGTPREPRSDRLRKENAHMGAKNKHMLSDYDRDHLCNARSHANNARVGTNDRLQTTTPVRALSPARASCDRARVAGGAGTGVLQGVESGSRPVLALPARAHTQAEMQRQGEGEGMRHIRAEPPQGQVAPRDKTRVQEAQRPPPPQVQRPQRSPPQQQAQPPSPTPRKPLPSLQAKAPAKRRDVQLGVQVPSRSTFDFSFPRAVSCAPKGEENEVGVGREGKGVEAPARSRTPLFLLSNSSTPTTPTFSLSPAPFVEASSSSWFSHAAGAAGEGAREGMEAVPQWRLSMIPGHELNVIRSGDVGIGMGGVGSFGERSGDPSSSTFAARMEDVSGDEPETPQVLIIPELLRRIFEFSSHESNISYARVCKNWSEEALSVLWSSVEAYPLFALLAPMTQGFGSEWSFSRDVEEVDWERFERYSWRVKSLQFNTQFSASVFHAVAVGRRRLDFLPNLEAVYNPPPNLNLFPLFAHASVKTLEVHPGFDAKNMGLLPSRMPHIECLTCLTRGASLGSIIPSALQQLQSLIHLTISDECLNVDLFHALAALPNLCSISTRTSSQNNNIPLFGFGTPPPPSGAPGGRAESVASKVFPLDPFPSLKELDVQLRFTTAIEWIQIASRSGSLRILKIHSPHKESAADYMQLTSHIGLLCMRLENLELSRRASAGCISAEASCGIESLTGLKSLTLRAFDARSDSQIERMLEPLSALETMSITGGQIKTPLHQIALIAHHCGKLHTLELDVDTWKMPSAALPDSFFLRHLRQLHVGAANISQTQATFVATFLSRVLPLSCTIEFDSSLPPDVSDTWGEVQKWVPVLIKIRLEERGLRSESNFGFLATRAGTTHHTSKTPKRKKKK
ncbi:hypothetical protein AB1N83_012883 [Pleurotus pulmonarius]